MNITIKTPHDWPFEIDRQQLVAAAEALGVKRDIELRVVSQWRLAKPPKEAGGKGTVIGDYIPSKSVRLNYIELSAKPSLTLDQLNDALLHELAHAHQFELMGVKVKLAQMVYEMGTKIMGSVAANPIETDAEVEATLAARFKPVRALTPQVPTAAA